MDDGDGKEVALSSSVAGAQLRALFESNLIGVVLADAERILDANDAFLELIGYTRDDLRAGAVSWPRMTPPEYRERDEEAMAELRTRGTSAAQEKEYLRKDGSRAPVLVAGALLERSPFRWIAYVRDRTAHGSLEEERRDLSRQRDAFVESVAHDLKTPITKIKGQAQLLQLRLGRAGAADVSQLLEGLRQIDATASNLTAQINGLLDLTRIEQGNPLELTLRSVDLVALARRIAQDHQVRTSNHQITVEAGVPRLVTLADELRLERVLNNLLANAVRYSLSGGRILVRITSRSEAGRSWADLTVADGGIGIPAADLPRIFERFYRGSNVVGRILGSGVGLAGARQIVEQHGGTISVESREGQGSVFTVRLPLMPAE